MDQLKNLILKYVKDYYGQTNEAPTLKNILQTFNVQKLNNSKFYRMFPGGLPLACKLAAVPAPEERLKRTTKATEAAKMRTVQDSNISNRLLLSEEQTKRIFGISHLENGKDALLIVDNLLEIDMKLRKNYKLSFDDINRVSKFLDTVIARGWTTTTPPNIIDQITNLYNIGLINQPPETIQGLIEIVNELIQHKWDTKAFVNEATNTSYAVYWFRQYKNGKITSQEFNDKVQRGS